MYFSLIIWLVFLMLICSKIKQNHWKIVFSKISSILVTLELASIYLTDRLVDYRVYTHFNIDAILGYGFQFITHAFLLGGILILLGLFLYLGSKKIERLSSNNKVFIPSILALFVILSWPGGVLNEAYKIYEIVGAEEKTFDDALVDLGITPEKYITPEQLEATKGKNIIVISIESLEQGFLGKEFDNIAPNLNRLSNELTYYNKMPPSPGSGWTAASLYSHQVGMPAFFKGQGNDFFQGATDAKLTGLGHILNVAGYQTRYLIGNDAFAGTSDLLSVYGIQTVSEKNSLGDNYKKVRWGFHDLDLFREAKLQIKEFDIDKPFALFLSTVNTHFPHGIYDKRMEKIVPKSASKLEFSVTAVDYLINDFIEFLKQENLYENSAIFIFPDHLLMGSSGSELDKLKQSIRQLYLITNIAENNFQKKTSGTLYQTDLPRMIIDGAEIKSNAVFFSDFHKNVDMIKFVKANKVKLTALNSASLERRDFLSGFNIMATKEGFVVNSNSGTISFPNISNNSEVLDITFNAEMVMISSRRGSIKDVFKLNSYDKKHERLHLIIFIVDGVIERSYFGNKQLTGITKIGREINYTENEVRSISNNLIFDEIEKNKKVAIVELQNYQQDTNRFIAHAGGQIGGNKYTNSLEALDLNYKNGLRLFELDIIKTLDGTYVAGHDWKHWRKITGYKGELPPDRDTFKQQKIYGQYTPLDIGDINEWFKQHADAILVTDKVNAPIDFSNKFIDKKRLMMELFTWDAVEEGLGASIKSAMPTFSLLREIKGDKLSYLKQLGVTDIASSRRIINTQKELLSQLSASGINIYAFHLHFDKGADEKHVVCNERKYFYGMYADQWDFNKKVDCTN